VTEGGIFNHVSWLEVQNIAAFLTKHVVVTGLQILFLLLIPYSLAGLVCFRAVGAPEGDGLK